MDKAAISILMPTHTLEFINEAIASVKKQSYKRWELLIGANNYPKGEKFLDKLEKEAEDPSGQTKIIDLGTCKTKSEALNKLTKEAKYDIICLLDSDDIWAEDKLAQQIKLIASHDVVGTGCEYFGETPLAGQSPMLPYFKIDALLFQANNPIINSSAMLHKKDAHWDESLPGVEDYELWLRLNYQKKSFYNIPHNLCKHRLHDTSYFNTQDFSHIEKQIRQRWLPKHVN
jgi:glycosyltransferase involved in cell wall biosynthesis